MTKKILHLRPSRLLQYVAKVPKKRNRLISIQSQFKVDVRLLLPLLFLSSEPKTLGSQCELNKFNKTEEQIGKG